MGRVFRRLMLATVFAAAIPATQATVAAQEFMCGQNPQGVWGCVWDPFEGCWDGMTHCYDVFCVGRGGVGGGLCSGYWDEQVGYLSPAGWGVCWCNDGD